MTDIRLSEEHGVNPSMSLCFWCRETKEIVLLGKLPNDEKAPKEMFTSYEPCEDCQKLFEDNFLMVEVTEEDIGIPTIDGVKQPTGNYWVITKEAAERVLPNHIYEKGKALLDKDTATDLGLYASEEE